MNKKEIIKGLIVFILTISLIIGLGIITFNTQSLREKAIEGLCESAGGETKGWNCSYECVLDCQYPNGTQVNLTKELNKIESTG